MTFLNPPFIISILIALSVHEWAHGYAAFRLGDPTARDEGRLTLNPLAHLDPIGTLMFLIIGFGWGKPVPIDPRYFRHPKRDTALTAIAGPLSNLVLACIAFVVLMVSAGNAHASPMALLNVQNDASPLLTLFGQIAGSSLFINLALMAFNLLPIAPLDGSKVLNAWIPARYEHAYFQYMQRGPMILLGLIIAQQLLDIPILSIWVFGIIEPMLSVMSAITGLVT